MAAGAIMKRAFSGVLGLVAGVIAAPAFAVTLECSIAQSPSGGGYITETYVFQHEDGAATGIVSDGLILYYFDQPVEAKVTDDTSKKLVFSWNVQITNSTGQQTKMMFRATYFRQNAKMTVRATPGGYANSFEGRGTCRPV
jgi:hypothetical protein